MKSNKFALVLLLILTVSTLGQNFSFAVMSDSRGRDDGVNSVVLKKLVHHLLSNNKDVKFIIFFGDLIDGVFKDPFVNLEQLKHWKQVMSEAYESPELIGPKVYVTPGNHEIRTPYDEAFFRKVFPNMPKNGPMDEKGLTYSFDYQGVHFLIIDNDRWYYGDLHTLRDDKTDWHKIRHLDWVVQDLAKAKSMGSKWIFVGAHEMPFPVGGHLHDGLANLGRKFKFPLNEKQKQSLRARDSLWNSLVRYGASAYFSGHEHLYGRLSYKGVYQIVAGSSGAPVYDFNPTFEQGDSKRKRQEFTYKQALPYYKAMGYQYGPGKKSQISNDFVGKRAMHYVLVKVKEDSVIVKTFGMLIKKGSSFKSDGKIKLIDEFVIRKNN